LTKDAGWQISAAHTFDMDPEDVWEYVTSKKGIAIWLGEGLELPPRDGPISNSKGAGEVKSNKTADRLVMTWKKKGADHETSITVSVSGSVDATSLKFYEENLATEAERFAQRDFWKGVLKKIVAGLE